MREPKFRIGQIVGLRPSERDAPDAQTKTYKILRLIPRDGAGCAYAVKSILESAERIANEDELMVPRTFAPARDVSFISLTAERNAHDQA